MRTTTLGAVAVSALLLLTMVPLTIAETVTDRYDATLGVRVLNSGAPREGLTLSWTPFGDCVDDVVDEDSCEVPGPNIGGGSLTTDAGDVYTEIIVSASDDSFDSSYIVACLILPNADGVLDNICDDDENDVRADGCGNLQLTTDVLFGGENDVTMFVSTIVVMADTLETCAASSGEFVGVFS